MSARTLIEASGEYHRVSFREMLRCAIVLQESPDFSLSGKTAYSSRGWRLRDLSVNDVSEENIVVFRQPKPMGVFPEGWTIVYFMDTATSADAMRRGEIPYLLVPTGTFMRGGDPITDVWKRQFQKPGTEHIVGLLQGHTTDKKIYIDMMSVRPKWRRNRVNSLMIDALKQSYPNAKLEFSDATDAGKKFISAYPGARGVVESSDFESWFAGSKIVDGQGRPLRVYHGTNQDFESFDMRRGGAVTAALSAKQGFFFTSDPGVAEQYANFAAERVVADVAKHERDVAAAKQKVARLDAIARRTRRPEDWEAVERATEAWEYLEAHAVQAEPQGQNIRPAYLRMVNPLVVPLEGHAPSIGTVTDWIRRAKSESCDGLILQSTTDAPGGGLSNQYVVFSTDQVRSAIGVNKP